MRNNKAKGEHAGPPIDKKPAPPTFYLTVGVIIGIVVAAAALVSIQLFEDNTDPKTRPPRPTAEEISDAQVIDLEEIPAPTDEKVVEQGEDPFGNFTKSSVDGLKNYTVMLEDKEITIDWLPRAQMVNGEESMDLFVKINPTHRSDMREMQETYCPSDKPGDPTTCDLYLYEVGNCFW